MKFIILLLFAIPLAAAGTLYFIHRSGTFKKLMRPLIIWGIVFGLATALFIFLNATVPIAPYETGRGAWTPVITAVGVAFLEGFSLGVLFAALVGIPWLHFRRRSSLNLNPPTEKQ